MKIVYITSSSFVDGDFPLIKHLIEIGVEVHLFIRVRSQMLKSTLFNLKQAYPESGIFDSSIYGYEIDKFKSYIGIDKINVINTNTLGGINGMYAMLRSEREAIKKINPDIVHFIGWPEIYEVPLTFLFPRRVIITIHDPVPHTIEKRAKRMRLFRLSTNWINKRYILLNKSMTNDFCDYYNVNPKKIRYSRLGNFDVIKLFGQKEHLDKRVVLFVGRISEYKGVEYLLEAYSQIASSFSDTKLIVAGGGKYYFDKSKYESHPQIEIINRYIDMDEMGYMFKNCEFVVCPYITATQSGVVVSALAVNKPVIVTSVGGLPSMIEDQKSGLIIPPKNVKALADAMTDMLSHYDKIESMRKYIERDSIDGDNSWGKIAQNYIDIYTEFLN